MNNAMLMAFLYGSQIGGGLGGFFDKFCSSNEIADKLEKETVTVNAQRSEMQRKFDSLKNGNQAKQWDDLKKELIFLEDQIEKAKEELEQESVIAMELGLGAFCKDAQARREKAENALQEAERALGSVKGAYDVLEIQQTQGIKRSSEVIELNLKTLESLNSQVAAVKQKIENYKKERDNQLSIDVSAEASNIPKNESPSDFFKGNNFYYMLGGLALTGLFLYKKKKKKGEIVKEKVKKVKL